MFSLCQISSGFSHKHAGRWTSYAKMQNKRLHTFYSIKMKSQSGIGPNDSEVQVQLYLPSSLEKRCTFPTSYSHEQ